MAEQVDRQPVQTRSPEPRGRYPGEGNPQSRLDVAGTFAQLIEQATTAALTYRAAEQAKIVAQARREAPERGRQAQGGGK